MREQKRIRRLYSDLYQEVQKQINSFGSDDFRTQNLLILQRNINSRLSQLSNAIQNGIISDIETTSIAVVEDCRAFLKSCGYKNSDIHDAFNYVPSQIVENIYTGNVYQNGWTLSKALWSAEQQNRGRIDTIISKGTAQGKSAYEVAKDLEKFVKPEAKKESRKILFQKYKRDAYGRVMRDSNGKPIINTLSKKDTFYFGSVDYNAQRLARTLISHAYQQSFRQVNEHDPFVKAYVWHSAGLHGRTCDICLERDGKLFKKDELPEDHPNGMCTYEAYIPDSMEQIADKIADWYESPLGTFPELDRYALDFVG